jgi:hypothetical protein
MESGDSVVVISAFAGGNDIAAMLDRIKLGNIEIISQKGSSRAET